MFMYHSDNPRCSCKHHLCENSLTALFRNGDNIRCPIVGCPGRWSQKYTVPDKEFQYTMERFYRNLSAASANNSQYYSQTTSSSVMQL